jgi:hypothetical protein
MSLDVCLGLRVQQAGDSPATKFVFISAATAACGGAKALILLKCHYFMTELFKLHGVERASVVFCLYGQQHSASGGRVDRVLPYRSVLGYAVVYVAFSCRCLHRKLN